MILLMAFPAAAAVDALLLRHLVVVASGSSNHDDDVDVAIFLLFAAVFLISRCDVVVVIVDLSLPHHAVDKRSRKKTSQSTDVVVTVTREKK